MVKFYSIQPGDVSKLPAYIFNALCEWLPALEAEQNINIADIVYTFAQPPQSNDDAKKQAKRRERYIRQQQNIISRVRRLCIEAPEIETIEAPIKRIDPSKLSEEEKAKLAEWAKSIGAA